MAADEQPKANSIGEFVKNLAEEANLTPTAFGKKINSTLNNVKDIYKRSSIDSELLLQISKGLNKSAFAYYDDKEPIASLKKAELDEWNSKIEKLNSRIERLEFENHSKDSRIDDLLKRIADQEEIIRLLKEKENFFEGMN